jgi:hypothetical protein
MTRETRHAAMRCPSCGATLDTSEHPLEDISPEPGNLSLCVYCGAWLVFAEGLVLRRATPEEIRVIQSTNPFAVALAEGVVDERRRRSQT